MGQRAESHLGATPALGQGHRLRERCDRQSLEQVREVLVALAHSEQRICRIGELMLVHAPSAQRDRWARVMRQ
jgi:predicted secreted protein